MTPSPRPAEPLDPTALVRAWLADDPDSYTEARSRERLAAHAGEVADAERGERAGELDELRGYLEKRVSTDPELAALRQDLAKYAAMHAPRAVADMPGMVAWSLTQVDWDAVAASGGAAPGGPRAG